MTRVRNLKPISGPDERPRPLTHDLTVYDARIEHLKCYANNPRKHSRRQINKIAKSIEDFGFVQPILIDEDGAIIAGHGRYHAALQLKRSSLPVICLRGLSEAEKIALRLADNRIAEGSSWDEALLAGELKIILSSEIEIESSGFDLIDIDKILTPDAAGIADEDAPLPPLPSDPVCRPGDLWQLGDHRVLCGDARNPATYERLLGAERADLIFTDPPYNVPIAGNVGGRGVASHKDFAMASGEMTASEFEAFLELTLGHARDMSRDGSLHYICMDWRGIGGLIGVGTRLFKKMLNICVWTKSNAGMGSFYRSQHEMIAIFKHGAAPHVNNVQLGRLGRHRSNVWSYAGANSFSTTRKKDLADHPTVKPLALVAEAIRDASNPGSLILDPFGGSGTTLLAAQTTGRRAALIEIDPRYVDVICERFKAMSGVKPVRIGTLMSTSPSEDNP